jgi:hypothetical protein
MTTAGRTVPPAGVPTGVPPARGAPVLHAGAAAALPSAPVTRSPVDAERVTAAAAVTAAAGTYPIVAVGGSTARSSSSSRSCPR